ncbi:hypothetical protein J522_1954 [Acinetobacter baumannii 146457]|nr:hypothetical protein J522_1954 [Acinetobacter baumannii 146457]
MTDVQQNPQDETENTKATTGPRKRGPKPKNAADNAAGNNTEPKSQNEQQGAEESSGVISSSQTELQSSTESLGNHSPEASNAQGEASKDEGDQSSVDQNKSDDGTSDNVNSGPENNQGQQAQQVTSGGNSDPSQSGDEQSKTEQVNNNENIVVQETAKADIKPKKGLIVKVKNVGLKAVYEPHSKISIEPGDEGTIIECANHADLKSVLANIDQLNALGKKIKVVNDE